MINKCKTDEETLKDCKTAIKCSFESLKRTLILKLNTIDRANTTGEVAGVGNFLNLCREEIILEFIQPVQTRLVSEEQHSADLYEQSKIDQAVSDWKFND